MSAWLEQSLCLKPHILDQFQFRRHFTWALSLFRTAAPAAWALLLTTGSQWQEDQRQPHRTQAGKVHFSAGSNIVQGWSPLMTTVNSVMWEYLLKSVSAPSTHFRKCWEGLKMAWWKTWRLLKSPQRLADLLLPIPQSLWSWPIPLHSARELLCSRLLTSNRLKSRVCWLPGNGSEYESNSAQSRRGFKEAAREGKRGVERNAKFLVNTHFLRMYSSTICSSFLRITTDLYTTDDKHHEENLSYILSKSMSWKGQHVFLLQA